MPWHGTPSTVFSEFHLGNEFRLDFLILSAHSGWWHAVFIELEEARVHLYLKDGTPSKQLRLAFRQIQDWKDWVRCHDSYLREQFARILRQLKEPAYCSKASVHTRAETEIQDTRVHIDYLYHIVIGRRATLTSEEQRRRAMGQYEGGPEIATYDRILNTARRHDEAIRERKRRNREWRREAEKG